MSDYMSFDLQIEIIKRVSFESVIKFRSVSKQWKSLIDSFKFIIDYTFRPQHTQNRGLFLGYQDTPNRNQNSQVVLIQDNDKDIDNDNLITFPRILESNSHYMITGSSYGLLFMLDVNRDIDRDLAAVISNPVLEKSVDVVVSDFPQPYDIITKSKCVIGFGVCLKTFDPKIVKYNNSRKDKPGVCEVFTLSSGVWRGIVSNLRSDLMFHFHSVVIDRFIYWFAYCNDGLHVIISFDLTSEEFGEICLPDKLARGRFEKFYPLYQLRESLVVVSCKRKDEKQVFKVWKMMENRSFTKLFTIRQPDGLVNTILGFRKNGQVLMEMVTEKDDNDNADDQPNDDNDDDDDDDDVEKSYVLVAYEPCSEQINNLGIYGRHFEIILNSYTESLLLLDQYVDGHIAKCVD